MGTKHSDREMGPIGEDEKGKGEDGFYFKRRDISRLSFLKRPSYNFAKR
jgi:hypothetical protein